MSFAAPHFAWLFLVLLPVIWLAIRSRSKKQEALELFAEKHLIEQFIPTIVRQNYFARTLLIALAACCLILALMRPQWGVLPDERIVNGLDIVIAIDLSRSMLANDLTPTRLAVAKDSIGQLLDQLNGDRVGIIAFAGTAFLVCPVTSDYSIVRRILAELGPESIPKGGSSLSSPLLETRRAFRNSQPGSKVLMILSDGEDHDGGIDQALERLRSEGIVVLAAMAGTREGGLIPLSNGGFVKDRYGAAVKSCASLEIMRSIDPGAVELAADGSGLLTLLERGQTACRESLHSERRLHMVERFQIPLGVALLLFFLAWVFPVRRKT